MSSYVGPNGRLYRRAGKGKAIGLTILAVTMIGLVIVGHQNMTTLFSYAGM
jgi:hypothetical protein